MEGGMQALSMPPRTRQQQAAGVLDGTASQSQVWREHVKE